MSWWLGQHPATKGGFFVFEAPTQAAAQSECNATGSVLVDGPFSTKDPACKEGFSLGQLPVDGCGSSSPPSGGGGGGTGGTPSPPPVGGGNGKLRLEIADRIVKAAQSWIGHAYQWDNFPGRFGQNPTDCSGSVNFWVGVEAGQAIPGFAAGQYDGMEHGPSTIGWLDWNGTGVFELHRSLVSGGDIMCWRTHMGVAISNTEMISNLNPSIGCQQTPIDGLIPGETLNCLRLVAVDPTLSGIGLPGVAGGAAIKALTRDIARVTQDMVHVWDHADRVALRSARR